MNVWQREVGHRLHLPLETDERTLVPAEHCPTSSNSHSRPAARITSLHNALTISALVNSSRFEAIARTRNSTSSASYSVACSSERRYDLAMSAMTRRHRPWRSRSFRWDELCPINRQCPSNREYSNRHITNAQKLLMSDILESFWKLMMSRVADAHSADIEVAVPFEARSLCQTAPCHVRIKSSSNFSSPGCTRTMRTAAEWLGQSCFCSSLGGRKQMRCCVTMCGAPTHGRSIHSGKFGDGTTLYTTMTSPPYLARSR